MDNNNRVDEHISSMNALFAVIVSTLILLVLVGYTYIERKSVVANAEQVSNQMAEYIASNISNEIGYAKSSIQLATVSIAQTMTSDVLDDPMHVILPMVSSTPFDGIEYIRSDGMNVMNIGEPFDASDRVYFIEGIKGNSGVWNNFHPKTSDETLMNFYSPLIYEGKIAGVITGYIKAKSQMAPLFETSLFGQVIYGLLVDENNMVICSTIESEYVKDLTLDTFMDKFGSTEDEKQSIKNILARAEKTACSYKDPKGEGRICVAEIPGTQWKVAIIVPALSFEGIVSESTKNSVYAIVAISLIIAGYASYILLRNAKRRKAIAEEKARLQVENLEIRDIISSANMGTWRIEMVDGKEPRMFVDDTMKMLLGIENNDSTPEETYVGWFANITPEAVQSVFDSVERMEQGYFDENTYLWSHPSKGIRYVRCGGTAKKIEGGYSLRGYHYDVDEVVRKEQAQSAKLKNALDDKNEYYATLETLGGIFYSLHVLDLCEDTVVEYKSQEDVKKIVNHKHGAVNMMVQVMNAVTDDEYKEDALRFTDLTTLSERMRNRKVISKDFIGKHTGWFHASFITMAQDKKGYPTKVIFTTRVIDDEKKQEEKLIKKTQTDELTGLLNRRAYEEDLTSWNDNPADDLVYVSLDVNGLKVINDTIGHVAGDEMIIGASNCLKKGLGRYGKLYRIGGDEFVAIIFVDAQKIESIISEFENEVHNWSGELVEKLSVSYGWAAKEECPEMSVRQLSAAAEQKMYESKAAHYRRAGFDRRGQKDAHKALCDLYTKILRINVTDDSYQIVNMDKNEQTAEKGFSEKLSSWLSSFGKSGQVHPDDLDEYLNHTDINYIREYFRGNKTSLHIFYRRMFEDGFKQVMMEIIPTNDYSDVEQTLFLYVKNIDK